MGYSRGTNSWHQAGLPGHGRTPRSGNLSSGGPLRSRRDTRGHPTRTVRDREAPGSNPGPRPKSEHDSGTIADPGKAPDHSRITRAQIWTRRRPPRATSNGKSLNRDWLDERAESSGP